MVCTWRIPITQMDQIKNSLSILQLSYFSPSTYVEEDLTYISRFNVCRLSNSMNVNEILSASYIPHICKHICDHTPQRSSYKVLKDVFYFL